MYDCVAKKFTLSFTLVPGGLLVYLAGLLEKEPGIASAWMTVMSGYGGIMILPGLYNSRALPSGGEAKAVHSFRESMATLKDVIGTFFQRKNMQCRQRTAKIRCGCNGVPTSSTPASKACTRT